MLQPLILSGQIRTLISAVKSKTNTFKTEFKNSQLNYFAKLCICENEVTQCEAGVCLLRPIIFPMQMWQFQPHVFVFRVSFVCVSWWKGNTLTGSSQIITANSQKCPLCWVQRLTAATQRRVTRSLIFLQQLKSWVVLYIVKQLSSGWVVMATVLAGFLMF